MTEHAVLGPLPPIALNPEQVEFVAVAFEGPDPYAQAGGLGVRMTGLVRALASRGFRVHFFFIGDPALPGVETEGSLTLYRWGQWISRYHLEGVYAAEYEKKADLDQSLPAFIVEQIAKPARQAGRRVAILTEEWQTAETAIRISDLLHHAGLRNSAAILWNANHRMGLGQIDFSRLGYVATITTVSRFMRQLLGQHGVNAVVIPNGIDSDWFHEPARAEVERLRRLFSRPLLVKVGRFDPDKRWITAVEAVAVLKARGFRPTLVLRGGMEPHGAEVFGRARSLGLTVVELTMPGTPSREEVLSQLEALGPDADVVHLRTFLPKDMLRLLYRAADAVLVQSGFEPFGLVGLEVMASGGIAITGGTGEDYARAFRNGLIADDDDPRRLADLVACAMSSKELRRDLVREGRRTARTYHWDRILDELLAQISLAFSRQGGQ
ncbi:glycosyltransferase family 4 protein [Sulfobacillus sp. DSM 109850]|uniref:Glycosyltransferase family 4 protein n=2 Tax=Sulfobacillus harzensis TaxID=2729629 RepID=A0A7Y0Q477_9FIRM|nr:glycosyltransferase family 4 protein [Sulfobacillus harzensis]